VHVTIEALGVPVALTLGLVVTLAWNLMLIGISRLQGRAAAAQAARRPMPSRAAASAVGQRRI
jgi:hypothetical protein